MTSTNAPQPTPTTGVAETFDDTIQPAPPTISADGGVGPNNIEAPVHAGSMNSFDAKYYTHWMGLNDLIWDTTQSPGQLLWSVPIHPDRSHQWLSWDAKKYYVWAGGFDFCVKVAGTGFHAGAVVCVRIPPGFSPDQFRTFNDLTAFDYKVIDPKTLEIVSMGIMDQRPVMYHYFPLDLKEKNSYGGHFAIYVMLPLRTSSTGVSQISLQVFTRPSRNFTMDQLIPIRQTPSLIVKPFDMERALDFTLARSSPTTLTTITGMTLWTKKSKVELTSETLNTIGFDGEYLNGDGFVRWKNVQYFTYNNQSQPKFMDDISSERVVYRKADDASKEIVLNFPEGESNIKLYKLAQYPNNFDKLYPVLGDGPGFLYFAVGPTDSARVRELVFPVTFQTVSDDDKAKGIHAYAKLEDVKHSGPSFTYSLAQEDYLIDPKQDEVAHEDNKKYIKEVGIRMNQLKFDLTYTPYAPPIDEALVTFQTSNGDVSMPMELVEVIAQSQYKNMISPSESLIFELWDEVANLPIIPLRLSYKGIITTLPQTTDRPFKFEEPERYKSYFMGILPTSTPLTSGKLPLATPRQYAQNQALSRLF